MTHEVFIVDDQHPEDTAMLQALYSRSPASVVTHLEKLKQSGSGKFMSQYYVGYGHASIGDCGTTTVFIEQVSMLVAKAVQDTPLYNGQEASTRYLDYSKQAVVDPYDSPESTAVQKRWMEIYHSTLPLLIEGLKAQHPFDANEYKNEKIWNNALNARAFDIARGLLPLGTTTLLSWTTSLRHARDHLRRLKYYPLPEVREVAVSTFNELHKKYPNSFKEDDMKPNETARDKYAEQMALQNSFLSADEAAEKFFITPAEIEDMKRGKVVARRSVVDLDGIKKFEGEVIRNRPAGSPLPWKLESYGRYNFIFMLDFGSFRDIQRHRNSVCRMPLIDGRFGLHPWYVEQFKSLMPEGEAAKLLSAINDQYQAIAELDVKGVKTSAALNQYLFPMGTMGMIHVSYSLPEAVYVGELRSAKTVHQSLRPTAQSMLKILAEDLPGIALYGDMAEDSWTAKRGEQTISAKG